MVMMMMVKRIDDDDDDDYDDDDDDDEDDDDDGDDDDDDFLTHSLTHSLTHTMSWSTLPPPATSAAKHIPTRGAGTIKPAFLITTGFFNCPTMSLRCLIKPFFTILTIQAEQPAAER